MKNTISLLNIFVIILILNIDIYANTITSEQANRWYMGGYLGTQFSASGKTKIPSINSNPPLTSYPAYHSKGSFGVSIGRKLNKLFHIEGEFGYQVLPVYKIGNAIGLNTVTNVKNSYTEQFSFFINGYYNLLKFDQQSWIPYLGVGLGYIRAKNTIKPTPPIPVSEGLFFTKKHLDYNSFGYQGTLGLAYHLTHNIVLNLNYRYSSTFDTKAVGRTNLGPDRYKTKQRIAINTILFGINYYF